MQVLTPSSGGSALASLQQPKADGGGGGGGGGDSRGVDARGGDARVEIDADRGLVIDEMLEWLDGGSAHRGLASPLASLAPPSSQPMPRVVEE